MANTIDTMAPEVILRKIIDGSIETFEDDKVTSIGQRKFQSHTGVQKIKFSELTRGAIGMMQSASNLTELYLPKVTALNAAGYQDLFGGTKIARFALPAISGNGGGMSASIFTNHTYILAVDFGPNLTGFGGNVFSGASNFKTLILRRSAAVVNATTTVVSNIFGGTCGMRKGGGYIYIPKVLYDHLGDGTSLDYKAASNWSAIPDSWGITWAQIEGSIYETQYADGTPVEIEGGGTE